METVGGSGSRRSGGEILFLHPIGLDRNVWSEVLLPGARTLDFPGHGSAAPVDTVSMRGLVDYVLAHICEPVTIVGLSLGGMVAQHLAIRAPGSVASLVVVCSTSASHPETMRERARATREGGMAGVLHTTLKRWFTPKALATPGHPGVDYARQRLLADDPEVFARYWEAMADHDVEADLGTITAPTTIIAGAHDRASSPETMERMARLIPDATFEILDGPHMLPLERPRQFREAMVRHLERSG